FEANEPRHQVVAHSGHRGAVGGDGLPGTPSAHIVIPYGEGSGTRNRDHGIVLRSRRCHSAGVDIGRRANKGEIDDVPPVLGFSIGVSYDQQRRNRMAITTNHRLSMRISLTSSVWRST